MAAGRGCGSAPDHLLVAERLLEVVARAGSSRHVVASVSVALYRAIIGEFDLFADPDVLQEVDVRTKTLREDLLHKVSAAAQGGVARLSGRQRAQRNVAAHVALGSGVCCTQQALSHPQRAQRGKRGTCPGATVASPPERSSSEETTCSTPASVLHSEAVPPAPKVVLLNGTQDPFTAKPSFDGGSSSAAMKEAPDSIAALPPDLKVVQHSGPKDFHKVQPTSSGGALVSSSWHCSSCGKLNPPSLDHCTSCLRKIGWKPRF
jgi:hypothetical protein